MKKIRITKGTLGSIIEKHGDSGLTLIDVFAMAIGSDFENVFHEFKTKHYDDDKILELKISIVSDNEDNTITKGDVVVLKSGSMPMTVLSVDNDMIKVGRFELLGSSLETHILPVESVFVLKDSAVDTYWKYIKEFQYNSH